MTDNSSIDPAASDASAGQPPLPPVVPAEVDSSNEQTDASSGPTYGNERVKIGSQRQADARFRAEVAAPARRFKPTPAPGQMRDLAARKAKPDAPPPTDAPTESGEPTAEAQAAPAEAPTTPTAESVPEQPGRLAAKVAESMFLDVPKREKTPLPTDLQDELDEMLAGVELDEMIGDAGKTITPELEPEAKVRGRVAKIHKDDVFIDLGGRNQGIVALHTLAKEPEIGQLMEVVIRRFLPEEGLYEISVPGASVSIQDWSELSEGLVVDARVTGHNKGGLECEVNRIRGFIPAGQVSMYRVEDLSEFVGQTLACVVTEANPDRRNLVLSRRGVLEREQAEKKEQLMKELQPGVVREGIVRRITDFGAFVDLGGVDGLIHISQMSWDRVKHPSEVLEVGQKVKAKIERIDPETGKIGLSYRDLFENPWEKAAQKYPVTSVVKGTVSRIMDFGAFVKLEPGVEGLVHISELSHKRVFRTSDVVQEGQAVEVKILSLDPEAQRISLSMKALEARLETPEEKKAREEDEAAAATDEARAAEPPIKKSNKPLKGGLGTASDGAKFGLKW